MLSKDRSQAERGQQELWNTVRAVLSSSRKGLPLQPVSRDGILPLSFAQERLWFLEQLEPDSAVNNLSVACRLVGVLDIGALERSLNEIVRRHEVLRATFPSVEGQPIQAIAAELTLKLPVIDLTGVPPAQQEKEVQRQTREAAQQPFDLMQGPLLRVKLLKLTEVEHVLVLVMHHIVFDGWSFNLFMRELSVLYEAFSNGKPSPLTELPLQYADFAIWQRQWLQGEVLKPHLDYWKRQLGGILPVLQLPTDRPRPPVQTYRGASQSLELPQTLAEALKSLSQQEGVTLFMTLLAAWQTLLYRYSGHEDIIVGIPIAGRNQVETEGLIGFFVNTLAIRTNLSGNPSFRQLLSRVREVALGAYTHQDLPFEKLVEALQPERDLSHSPLFQVAFVLQNFPKSSKELSGLSINSLNVDSGTAKFDLTLFMWETEPGLKALVEYNSDLFDAATITRMLSHFQTLLEGMAANPEQSIAKLPLLTDLEHHQLLVEWNDTQTDYPQDKCIHQLFEEQVERTPEAITVVFENQQLTYRELNRRANQLAHYLQKLGVKPEILVGICLERSPLMLVGLLGILKAGGAYVPLDPDYPQERLAFMLEDTQVPVLLTQQSLVEKLPANQAQILCLDTDWDKINCQSEDNPTCNSTADNLAYVTYTSGSTGKPKGVAVPHQAVTRLLFNTNYIQLEPDDKIAQVSNTSFDAATFEIWGALLHGGKLVLIPKDVLLSPQDFARQLREQEISVLFLTTALFNQLASTVPQAFKNLRYLLFGGEAVDPRWVKEILEKAPPQRLLHVYGPTESTTFSSWYLVQDVPADAKIIPIGCPISNTQIYILDRHLQPVPIGVPGELYIGGDGLAKGYLNRPELTEEKFIPNPFNKSKVKSQKSKVGDVRQPIDNLQFFISHSQAVETSQPTNNPKSKIQNPKLYKTGDLARYLPDGNIEFLGRIDNQVKIRGFRIELGEIEAVLSQYPLVQESVVVARVDTHDDKLMVAYLVPGLKSKALPQQVAQWESEYVSDWQTLYEQAYNQPHASTDDLTFNISGWNSSYTRQPIPAEEMREWVESTVSRILAVLPKRGLEIGCGTGLLLSRVAKRCQEYWGTDYSSAAIQHVEQVCGTVEGLENVRLLHQKADDFAGIPKGQFDTVILNSVVQYFPSVEYLLQVLEGAMAAIDKNGTIFVGDVRSLPLLESYHAAVQLSQASEERSIEQWQQQVNQGVAGEKELVIDPSFFIALRQRFPKITWVEIQPKRGHSQNELTQFRYDVTLHLGTDVQATVVPWLNWQLDQLSFTQIQNQLHQEQPELLGIRRVPNQRVQQALQIWEWLENPPAVETVRELRQLLAQQSTVGINPEQFWELGQHLGYTVHLSWWGSSQDGSFDVVFCRTSSTQISDAQGAIAFWDTETVTAKPWTDYTNNPLHGKLVQKLVPQVREFIQQKLPNYMMPQAFVLLNALPLTPNGKVDRRALPAPQWAGAPLKSTFTPPRTLTEEMLAQIWAEALGLKFRDWGKSQINIYDNFFELGGHSLVAARLISRVQEVFQIKLPLYRLFEFPTLAGLTEAIETERRTARLQPQTQLKPGSSLVAIQSGGSKRPFFLVPGGGGGENELIVYAKLVYLLGQEQPVYGFQARGWDGIQNPHNTVEAMAADYIKEIRTVQPEGYYLLGGECIGGVVALEMAQQLVAQGQKVGLLVFLDTAVPTLPRELRYHVEGFFQISRISYHLRKLQSLSEGDRLTYIFNQASKVKEKLAEDSLSRHLKKVAKNHIKIIKHYRPRTYPGRITWLVTESFSPKAQHQEWNHLAIGGLEIHQIPGTHNSYLGNNVETTAERLKACLDEAQADD
jgi:amino acid adenylation domain-containing protein